MRQPKVSVCIPTYRGAATLGAAIASVLAQSMADFELVVLDDNSPDNTADVVAGFADGRIRYLRNPANLGPEGNWNRCLTEARGAYVKVLRMTTCWHPIACVSKPRCSTVTRRRRSPWFSARATSSAPMASAS